MNQLTQELGIGMVPLSREEQLETTGGVPWLLPALIGGLIISAMNNFGDIREGFSDGYNDVKPRY